MAEVHQLDPVIIVSVEDQTSVNVVCIGWSPDNMNHISIMELL